MEDLAPKGPNEDVTVVFEFGDYLGSTEVPVSSTFNIYALRGTDPTPSARLSVGVISGKDIVVMFSDGVRGEDYLIHCNAVTNQGQTLTLSSTMPVRDPADY